MTHIARRFTRKSTARYQVSYFTYIGRGTLQGTMPPSKILPCPRLGSCGCLWLFRFVFVCYACFGYFGLLLPHCGLVLQATPLVGQHCHGGTIPYRLGLGTFFETEERNEMEAHMVETERRPDNIFTEGQHGRSQS